MKLLTSRRCKCMFISITIIGMFAKGTHAHAQEMRASESALVSRQYNNALKELRIILEDSVKEYYQVFKRAVFITENAFHWDTLDEMEFDVQITWLATLARQWMKYNPILHYKFEDSLNMQRNLALFKVIKDTVKIVLKGSIIRLPPYTYDFNDFTGEKEWSNMFVTKLLSTHSGNCHSLPYLYKILADEIGASCWLSLAPNHIYIENRCRKIGWYNTELTSGCFPIDAWIMASGYLPLKAVQSGIYMDTLSNRQSIALCILDLAKGYEHKTHNYTDGFILKCSDLSLSYFPLNVQAMLLKAETLKLLYEREVGRKEPVARKTYSEMQSLYLKLFDLGYREMPDQMYVQWLQSVVKERDKYANKQLKAAVSGN